MRYDKLVRDRIPEIIRESGAVPTTHTASRKEYQARLRAKLEEEVAEYLQEPSGEELADILEVVYALAELHNLGRYELEKTRREKAERRGAFKDRIVLDGTTQPDDP
jgi:predicted house-cleaning noncanonical NTP pyrophosphatase (MazG superfamily)